MQEIKAYIKNESDKKERQAPFLLHDIFVSNKKVK